MRDVGLKTCMYHNSALNTNIIIFEVHFIISSFILSPKLTWIVVAMYFLNPLVRIDLWFLRPGHSRVTSLMAEQPSMGVLNDLVANTYVLVAGMPTSLRVRNRYSIPDTMSGVRSMHTFRI